MATHISPVVLRMDDVLDLIRQARAPGWWRQYGISNKGFVALETAATRITNYEVSCRSD